MLLTNSSKGVNRHSAPSTALNASVSHALLSKNSPLSPTQRVAKSRHPKVKLRVRKPAMRDAAPASPVNTASATALPALNILRKLGMR